MLTVVCASIMIGRATAVLHSKNVFVTLTYSLSFERRHDSMQMFSYLLDTEFLYTHQSHNYYRCGILPCYYSGNQVMTLWYVDKYRLLLI